MQIPDHITPKQRQILESLGDRIHLLDRLDCEILPSKEYRMSTAVSNRVQTLLQEFEKARNSPAVKRSSIQVGGTSGLGSIFASPACIEAYLTSLYGPRPWKTPLQHAPFWKQQQSMGAWQCAWRHTRPGSIRKWEFDPREPGGSV